MIVYLLWRLATALVRLLPLRVSYAGAELIASLVFICWHEKRENTIANMRQVLTDTGGGDAHRLARDSWRNYGKCLVDFIRAPSAGHTDIGSAIEFDRWDILEEAFQTGKGVIAVLMHFGSWDIGGAFFSQYGIRVNVIAETFRHNRLNDMIVSARTASGMNVIPMEQSGLAILRALRRNEALAILIDRPGAENGVAVQFFGAETVLPDGPARLALRTGARVIAVAVARSAGPNGRLKGMVEADIRIAKTGDEREDVRTLTQALMEAHERFIRQYPDQWYMFRPMWRRREPVPA